MWKTTDGLADARNSGRVLGTALLSVKKREFHPREVRKRVTGTSSLRLRTLPFMLMVLNLCINNRPAIRAS
jgi:hypothetical protein